MTGTTERRFVRFVLGRERPMRMNRSSKWIAIGLILVIGIIHFVEAPDQFDDATDKGLLFLANGAGALIAAVGIWRDFRWGWLLGVLVAGGAAIAYIISRTVGLPGLPVDPAWFEPLGVVSVIAEVLFLALAGMRVLPRSRSVPRRARARAA
jgi:hypothetical protein